MIKQVKVKPGDPNNHETVAKEVARAVADAMAEEENKNQARELPDYLKTDVDASETSESESEN
ncbi:MAG: hypothetical protein SO006_06660 [Muribaculaceae bacterium]|nr:hypothetical protein [Muribaculaceae bacterium]